MCFKTNEWSAKNCIWGTVAALNWAFGLCLCLWMLHESRMETNRAQLNKNFSKAIGQIKERTASWTAVPFVDAAVFDASEHPRGCPASHPHELVYEVWLGTRCMCDCF